MPRKLWGEFQEDEKLEDEDQVVPVGAKRLKLTEMQNKLPISCEKRVAVKVKNSLVTQTIEVMKQTEMLQSLIDTYSNTSGTSNYLLNPCQMIPEVDFPPENVATLVTNEKFAMPFWFVPPQDTKFARGAPEVYPQINADICRASLRKAICGQLRVTGFTDTADSALILFTGAIEEFIRNLMQHVREVHENIPKYEMQSEIQVSSLEKAYFSLTNTSLTQVHNYFKHTLIEPNLAEIEEFNDVLEEYGILMTESQSMPKDNFEERDLHNTLEIPKTSSAVVHEMSANVGTKGMLGMLGGQTK